MEDILGQIGNLGFPIVLSIYLLVRLEGKIDNLADSIGRLTDMIEQMIINRT